MALGLTIDDNADGSGGVVTISGSAGGTVALWSQNVDGKLGSSTWIARGSRAGDGTIAVAPGNGFYWWKAVEAADVAPLVYQNLTDGVAAVWWRCLVAVQAAIQLLALDGIAGESVVVQKLPWDRSGVKPGIFVCPVREKMDPAAGTNERDDVVYPCHVVYVRTSNEDLTADLDDELSHRQRIARWFRNNELTGVEEVYKTYVEPGHVVLPEGFHGGYDVQDLVVQCVSRELRGLN